MYFFVYIKKYKLKIFIMKDLIISGELEKVFYKQKNIVLLIAFLIHLLVPSFLLLFNFFNSNVILFILIILISLYNFLSSLYVFNTNYKDWLVFTNISMLIFVFLYFLYYYLYLSKKYTTSSDPEIIKKYERRRKIKSIL
jgi:signal transduction histidine kinase